VEVDAVFEFVGGGFAGCETGDEAAFDIVGEVVTVERLNQRVAEGRWRARAGKDLGGGVQRVGDEVARREGGVGDWRGKNYEVGHDAVSLIEEERAGIEGVGEERFYGKLSSVQDAGIRQQTDVAHFNTATESKARKQPANTPLV
jgi:hypothetical protein